MCVSCDVKSGINRNDEMTVSPDLTEIVINYPVSWVQYGKVTSIHEPHGKTLMTMTERNVDDVRSVLGSGTFVLNAQIGLGSYGTTNCILVVPECTETAPFVTVVTKRPDFYR